MTVLDSTKEHRSNSSLSPPTEVEESHAPSAVAAIRSRLGQLAAWLRVCGVETIGITPVPEEDRTETRTYQLFLFWFAANLNLSGLTYGATGPVVFNLSLRDSVLVNLISNLIAAIFPAYLAIFGSKLGMRAMVQARYSWGTRAIGLPAILNVVTSLGYIVLALIVGGQLLSAASPSGTLSPALGITAISLISLAVCFFGYRWMHWFASLAWIPTVLGLLVMLGVSARDLAHALSSGAEEPPRVGTLFSYAATVAAAIISWCPGAPDYCVYHRASSAKIFFYTYLGNFLPGVITGVLGAAFAAAAPNIPAWNTGYQAGNDLGGLVAATLQPVGGFGKVLIVSMALAITALTLPSMYSFGFSLMNVTPYFARVPQYVYVVIATILCIPLGIFGETHFYSVLVVGVDMSGYWSASYAAIIIVEHLLFRRARFSCYPRQHWDDQKHMPPGYAATFAFVASFAAVVPCMAQDWYTGPVAKITGDVGVWAGFLAAAAAYGVGRSLERRAFGR
ncbi:unnamed protein product [Mycena citricolor]|uniref:Cytosine-purine permease n=1 Tax=Mycena citricolor TaxID=2018698 RepID=A0AAD2K0J0_9AGAR|nr:unnamed protein product [Mycena citricolor]